MKVLIATGLYPPEIGGPATYSALLETALPVHGCEVIVLPFSRSRHLPKVFRHIHYSILLMRLARRVDVIFAQDTVSVGLPALLVAKIYRCRFFVRVPGDYAWEQSVQRLGVTQTIDEFQQRRYGFGVEFFKKIQAFVVTHADTVITPSEYFRQLVIGWGVASDRVHTIYNGVNLDITATRIEKPSPLLMVTSGRLVEWKGIKDLIAILPALPGWKLVILGDGPERQNLEACIHELKLSQQVLMLGSVSREEVFGWCQVADVFVLNSSFESFSFQIVEAMYAGVPVVATNIGSIPELIVTNEHGVLVTPGDREALIKAIRGVVNEKVVWEKRTALAREKAETFSIERTVSALSKLLKPYV